MQKHPFFKTFCHVVLEQKKQSGHFEPVSKEHLVLLPPISTDYKKMACLVLAGGQGSRLGLDGPKGCVELPLTEKKTLFKLLFEKIQAKGSHLPVALMTSPHNHDATLTYLEKYNYFGLTNIEIFQQDLVPVCDEKGFLLSEKEAEVAQAPDGNGGAFLHLSLKGVLEKWKQAGVEVIQVVPIDNPLAEPFDPEFLGVHEQTGVELVLKGIKRRDSQEKIGVIALSEKQLKVCEYSELSEGMTSLSFPLGHSGLFSCRLDFAMRVASLKLPWHLAYKPFFISKESKKNWVWKFETFIFDTFRYAKSFKVIVGERKKCFAPLKNLSGSDSLETVSQAVMTLNG